MSLRELGSHADLLDATGGDPFVRYDIPAPLDRPGYAVGSAVALPRQTHTRRLGMLVMGPPDDVGELVGAMVASRMIPDDLAHMTISRASLTAVASQIELGSGDDWEWMYAASAPDAVPGETGLIPLSQNEIHEIQDLLDEANPRTDARPFLFPDQRWVGARDGDGRLVACGVREPNVAGWPILSGISVRPTHRGTGLGLAVTAYLTRGAVLEHGVCTLGMYSDNNVARRVYHGLGYTGDHAWSSRRLARPADGA